MHINVHTLTHIHMRGGWERTYTYIRWFITNLQVTPWVDAKRNKVLLVSNADRPCWYRKEFRCGRKGERHTTCNIVWNMERDPSFWITSSEHQGTMPERIFSFSCSMQVIQFADLQFYMMNKKHKWSTNMHQMEFHNKTWRPRFCCWSCIDFIPANTNIYHQTEKL